MDMRAGPCSESEDELTPILPWPQDYGNPPLPTRLLAILPWQLDYGNPPLATRLWLSSLATGLRQSSPGN